MLFLIKFLVVKDAFLTSVGKTIKDKTSVRECSNEEKTFVRMDNFEIKTIINLIKATDFDDFISTAETKIKSVEKISEFFLGFFNDPNDFVYLGILVFSYIVFLILNRKAIYKKWENLKRSPLFLLSTNVVRSKAFSLLSYDLFLIDDTSFVALC